MLASELKILKVGMKFQVLEDMYNVDIDNLVSDKIDTNAFNGMLNAVYLEKEIFQIIRNISKILDRGEKISKNDIIQIRHVEYNNGNITYIEFVNINSKETFGWANLRLNYLKKIK